MLANWLSLHMPLSPVEVPLFVQTHNSCTREDEPGWMVERVPQCQQLSPAPTLPCCMSVAVSRKVHPVGAIRQPTAFGMGPGWEVYLGLPFLTMRSFTCCRCRRCQAYRAVCAHAAPGKPESPWRGSQTWKSFCPLPSPGTQPLGAWGTQQPLHPVMQN